MKNKESRSLEEILGVLLKRSQNTSTLSIKAILEVLSGRGRWLILIFLSLPFCQPLQIPGVSTPFGIVIAFFGLRGALGKRVWLPKRILVKRVPSKSIQKTIKKSLRWLKKIRRFTHPRLSWLCNHKAMKMIDGLLIFILGVLLALPLPIPLTNLLAGWSILLVSLGMLEGDGILMLIGYFASLLTLVFFVLILFSIKTVF